MVQITKLLLVKGGLAKAPEAQEAASLDPGGLTMASEHGANDAPSRASRPEDSSPNCTSASAIGTSLEVVLVSPASTARNDCSLVCPLTTFQQEVGPSSSKISEPFDQPAHLVSDHTAEVCATRVVATTRTTSTPSLPPGHPQPQRVRTAWLPYIDPSRTPGDSS